MIILFHSSKTMKPVAPRGVTPRPPALIAQAIQLQARLAQLTTRQIATAMGVSPALAATTAQRIGEWTAEPARQTLAIDTFVGDMYSGLQAGELSQEDRDYADDTLRILSGLYGILRPYDGIYPYRLEMGYKLPGRPGLSLYDFWGERIAHTLPADGLIVNASSDEYTKTITPYVDSSRLVTPRFLTMSPRDDDPVFVVVHAKIARGAFARWLIKHRINSRDDMAEFAEIGYQFDVQVSTPNQPVFVCRRFEGKGLSVRLK